MRDFLATTAILALAVTTPALAQTGTEPRQDSVGEAEAETQRQGEIVVTARRREESLRDVPGTISAVTVEQLDARGPVAGSTGLLSSVPGVRFNDVSSENLGEVSIRGSGTMRATGADSGVGLFVNGAYAGASVLGGRNFKTLDYFDLERVEVLEGPQGALYGRNSEFGVVNIVLAKPQFRDSGYIRNTFTFDQNQNRLAAVGNKALSDQVAVRVGFETFTQSKGFYYNPTQDSYYDQTKGWTARGQIRYRSGPVDVTLLVDAQDLALPTFVNRLNIPAGTSAQIPLGLTQDRYSIGHSGDDGMQQKVQRVMLMASYDFDWAKLESTSMATHWHSTQQFASAVDLPTLVDLRQQGQIGIYPFAQVRTDSRNRTLYQDIHLTGASADGQLTWIAGAEGLYQRDSYRITSATSPCAFNLVNQVCTGTPTMPECVRVPGSVNCPATFPLAFGTDRRTEQRIYSVAAYASLQYAFGNFTANGEARFTHDYKTATQEGFLLYTNTVNVPATTFVFKADQPAYTFTASYKIPGENQTLLYAKVGTGYRAGGVNNGSFNANAPNPFQTTYENESTVGYEIGVKTSLARNVNFRMTGYLSRTHDAITSINDGCTLLNACGTGQQFFNVNGGTIHARGLQAALDARFRVAGGVLTLEANGSTQRARFAEVPAGVAGLPIEDTPVAQIPDWTMSGTINYRRAIAGNVTGFVNFNYTGQRGGGQDTVTVATPYIPLSDYDIFGVRAGLDIDRFRIAMFVRNLTDEQVETLKFYQANGAPYAVRYNRPRTIGVTGSYRW